MSGKNTNREIWLLSPAGARSSKTQKVSSKRQLRCSPVTRFIPEKRYFIGCSRDDFAQPQRAYNSWGRGRHYGLHQLTTCILRTGGDIERGDSSEILGASVQRCPKF